MTAKLKDLIIDRVDLCAKGSNQESHVLLFKREGSVEKAETFNEAFSRMQVREDAKEQKHLAVDAFMESLKSIAETAEEGDRLGLIMVSSGQFVQMMEPLLGTLEATEEPFEMAEKEPTPKKGDEANVAPDEQIEALKAQLSKAIERAEAAETQLAKAEKEGEPEDIWKGVNPEVKKQFDAMHSEIAKAKADAALERETRERQEAIAKASGFQFLPVNPDDDWEIFKSLDSLPDVASKRIYELLRAGDSGLEKANLTKEKGFSGNGQNGNDTAWGRAQVLISEKVGKSDNKLTYDEAAQQVFRENPELYKQYLRETQVRVGKGE